MTKIPPYTPYNPPMGAPSPVSPLHIGVSEGQKGGIIPFAVFVQKNPKKNFWKILGKMDPLCYTGVYHKGRCYPCLNNECKCYL